MKRITILAAAGALAVTPALGAWAAFAAAGDDAPAATHVRLSDDRRGEPEPGDDHGRHHRHGADDGRHHERHHHRHGADDRTGALRVAREAEPGDDRGGHREAEPGDDHGGRGEAEPGDDHGGHHGGDDGGRHGGGRH